MKSAPSLALIKQTLPSPPRPLGKHGTALWTAIQEAYTVEDAAGAELLCHACVAADRAEALAEVINKDGPVIFSSTGTPRPHPALSAELNCRHFIAKSFERLGLHFEPVKQMGRPPSLTVRTQ
jgi:hypothetical protein